MIFTINPPLTDAPQVGQTQQVFDANASGTLGYLAEFVASWNSNVSGFNTDIASVNNSHVDVIKKHEETISARDEAVSAKDEINNLVIPTEATYSYDEIKARDSLKNDAMFTGYGLTQRVPHEERYLETDTPNVIVDTVGDSVRFSDGLVDRLGEELVTNGDFSSDDLSMWSTGDGGIISVDNGKLKLTNGDTDYSDAFLDLSSLQNGKSFRLLATICDGTIISRAFFGGTYAKSLSKAGDFYVDFIADGTQTFKVTLSTNQVGAYGFADNISVRELPQAVLPEAPFTPNSTDELLDYSVNGVTTQIDHNVGDIVMCGNGSELVDVNLWSDSDTGSHTVDGTSLECTVDSGSSNFYIKQALSIPIGTEYLVRFTLDLGSADSVDYYFDSGNDSMYLKSFAESGVYSYTFIAKDTSAYNTFYIKGDGSTATISNVSIVAIEQPYQAITPTVAGDLLNDTSKYQQIDSIVRYDVYFDTPTGIKSLKGLHYYDELYSTDDIASNNGWSKLGNGLYHDGTQEITNVRLVQRLC